MDKTTFVKYIEIYECKYLRSVAHLCGLRVAAATG